uniref:Uncharacterized protein n=1 Tax=Cyanothece sp. (strain PCC 7425 / ATCC 29141) TaxID=395961 RepID=B8HN50_CYAP4
MLLIHDRILMIHDRLLITRLNMPMIVDRIFLYCPTMLHDRNAEVLY